eukprot:scaffold5.g683.t1
MGLTLRRPQTTVALSQTIGPSEVQLVEEQLDADKLGFAYKVRPYLLFCGGVFTSQTFLQKFYPDLAGRAASSLYCTYATADITIYTGAGGRGFGAEGVAETAASQALQLCGDAGDAHELVWAEGVWVFAQNRAMILAGRMILGLGNGFNEHLINWGVRNNPNGWQISLGMVCVPSGLVLAASKFMPDSPTSLLVRGKPEAAERALQRLRGPVDVAPELVDLKAAAGTKSPGILASWRLLASDRWCAGGWSGNATVVFCERRLQRRRALAPSPALCTHSPQIFKLLEGGTNTALIDSVVIGVTKVCGVFLGLCLLDRFKRRILIYWSAFFQAAAQARGRGRARGGARGAGDARSLITTAVLFAVYPPAVMEDPNAGVSKSDELVYMAGQSMPVHAIMGEVIITFGVALWGTINTYAFTYELCAMKWGIYLFMASIATLLGIWAWLLVPETSRVPIERLQATFEAHWVWKRFFPKGDVERPAFQLEGKAAKEGSDDSGSR